MRDNKKIKNTVSGADETVRVNSVHGISPDEKIVLFSEVVGDPITSKDMGVHRVNSLISRLKLMDPDKATVDINEGDAFLNAITVKQGRKKVDYTFADPEKIRHPHNIQQDEIKCTLEFNKEQATALLNAVVAMQPAFLTFEGRGEDTWITLDDGNSDSFEDRVGTNTAGDWKSHWNVTSVTRLLKFAIKESKTVTLKISHHGFLFMEVAGLTFLVVPEVQR